MCVCERENKTSVKKKEVKTTKEQISTPRGLNQILRKLYRCLFLGCADF